MSFSSSSLVADSVSRCRKLLCEAATRDRVAVETPRLDRDVALRLVQRDRFRLLHAGLEHELPVSDSPCLGLDRAEHRSADAVAALVGLNVHALHFAHVFVVPAEATAADGVRAAVRDEEHSVWWEQFVRGWMVGIG